VHDRIDHILYEIQVPNHRNNIYNNNPSPVWQSSGLFPAVELLPDLLGDLLGVVRRETTKPTLVQEVRAEVDCKMNKNRKAKKLLTGLLYK
jgi:hypothetical protein